MFNCSMKQGGVFFNPERGLGTGASLLSLGGSELRVLDSYIKLDGLSSFGPLAEMQLSVLSVHFSSLVEEGFSPVCDL